MQEIRLGCDPEVFLRHQKTGAFISSVGLIGGSKNFPRPIGAGCSVQEDNVSVEFNIPPAATAGAFIDSINYNKQYIRNRAAELGLDIAIVASAVFDDDQLETDAAREFGCEPDFNAWLKGAQNPRPRAENPNLRSAGGHIHIELPEGTDVLQVVKCMDLYVGCQMLRMDDDKDRRQLYGKPGAFRPKQYGVEYRTASNAWIATDETIKWAWDQTERAVTYALQGIEFTDEQAQKIQDCLNNSDMALLEELTVEFKL